MINYDENILRRENIMPPLRVGVSRPFVRLLNNFGEWNGIGKIKILAHLQTHQRWICFGNEINQEQD